MNTSPLLNALNKAQYQAVTISPQKHIFVLAGAGTGKTRCLTHRIAWLIETQAISPYHILAVTFTNKASNEMKSRINALLNRQIRDLWASTFHSTAHRLLRIHWQEANLPQAFQILDDSDQLRLIKRLTKDLGLTNF